MVLSLLFFFHAVSLCGSHWDLCTMGETKKYQTAFVKRSWLSRCDTSWADEDLNYNLCQIWDSMNIKSEIQTILAYANQWNQGISRKHLIVEVGSRPHTEGWIGSEYTSKMEDSVIWRSKCARPGRHRNSLETMSPCNCSVRCASE